MYLRQVFWAASFLLTFLLCTIAIFYLVNVHGSYHPDAYQLFDKSSTNKYLNDYWKKTGQNLDKLPFYIPTGVFIESIDWLDANSFYISGYVWQKYPHASKGKISQGFVLPEAVTLKKRLAYRWENEEIETVGWFFEGKISQRFDYTKYPFDHKTVRLRMWHEDFNQKALLTPDLVSYDNTRPTDKFGIDPEIVLGGYDIIETFFRYQHHEYDSSFGYVGKKTKKNFPELYYNIVIKRNALDALIINVLPLIIVIILCFSSLLSITFDEAKREIYNFRFLEILTQCGALFFVILLAHIHLREVLAGVGIVYLEYMYVIAYICIVYVAVNAFLVVHAELTDYTVYRIIKYEDNLLPKVLFLPIFSAAALIVSIYFF